jgi:DNA-binding MurR/RpiR family transcriptional regulator
LKVRELSNDLIDTRAVGTQTGINMDNNKDILLRMKELFPKMSKSHKAIADYIPRNLEQAVFMTAAKLGETLHISESTVVRFATGIGYEGYPEFQKALEECVKGKLSNIRKLDAAFGNRSQSEILHSIMESDRQRIEETMQHIDPVVFEQAVDTILKADHIYIMALRSNEPLAGFLHFYLNMVRGNVFLIHTTSISETFEQMIRIQENDCFIGISFPRYSMRTLKAMEFANQRSAKVIAITDSVHSPMNLYSSCNLFAQSDMVSIVDSLVAPLSLINALVVALCLKCPEEVRHNLEMLEDAWGSYQVYLSDEINFIGDEPMLNYSLRKEEPSDE